VASRRGQLFTPLVTLGKMSLGKTTLQARKDQRIFSQGDAADAVFYIQAGQVKLTVLSKQGKEAVVGILDPGSFFGESCLAGQPLRMEDATAFGGATLVRIDKDAMVRLLHDEPTFAEQFMTHLLKHNIRIQEDLVNQLFNSSEKRLAHFGKDGKPEAVIPKISQETLAEMIGTTRSRVSFFMNKFRNLGFIDYNGQMRVHSSLLSIVLHD